MINGVTLSVVFVVYELSSIVSVFIISALVFGILGFIGYKTNRDLNSWGTYIIVLSLLNLIVFRSSVLDIAIDWLILILFCGATIYDINKIKVLQESADINQDKIHIYCAMQLYLDFINIFLRILSLFGKSKD